MDIAEKIEKLLSLATSDNENEAKLAMEKAMALLTKYNLTMEDIKQNDYAGELVKEGERKQIVDKYIQDILQDFFFVDFVLMRGYHNDPRHVNIKMFGKKENVKVAAYVYDFLAKKFQQLWRKYKKTYGGSRNSYFAGLHRGLSSQLENGQKKVESETGLMVVKDPRIREFMEQEEGPIRDASNRAKRLTDARAFNQGKDDGKNIRIHKGVESKAVNRGRRLTG